jgi:hypothetical protein
MFGPPPSGSLFGQPPATSLFGFAKTADNQPSMFEKKEEEGSDEAPEADNEAPIYAEEGSTPVVFKQGVEI